MNLEESAPRAETRYPFEVAVHIELSRGLFRPCDRVEGRLVDMSKTGAAIVMGADVRMKDRKRYRVVIDDHAGIIVVRNITPIADDLVRVGVEFKSLGLELQEIVADAIQEAQWSSSRLGTASDPSVLTSGR